MTNDKGRLCVPGPQLIFSCSGAADVGEISDRAARKMTQKGLGKMFCLAGIGGQVNGIIKTTQTARGILAIDGCSKNCAYLSLELAGFSTLKHLVISNLGLIKGKTKIDKKNINKVIGAATALLKEL